MGRDTLDFVSIEYSNLISLKGVINNVLPAAVGTVLTTMFVKAFSGVPFASGANSNNKSGSPHSSGIFRLGISQHRPGNAINSQA